MHAAYVYILRRADGSYYVGSAARGSLERRLDEHSTGINCRYTKSRRPVTLVWSQAFQQITDAIAAECQIKGWSRAKKEALIRGDFETLRVLAQNRSDHPRPSTSSG
jgi:putative endonuclease